MVSLTTLSRPVLGRLSHAYHEIDGKEEFMFIGEHSICGAEQYIYEIQSWERDVDCI